MNRIRFAGWMTLYYADKKGFLEQAL